MIVQTAKAKKKKKILENEGGKASQRAITQRRCGSIHDIKKSLPLPSWAGLWGFVGAREKKERGRGERRQGKVVKEVTGGLITSRKIPS